MNKTSPHGHPQGKADANGLWVRNSAMPATKTALKAVAAADRYNGMIAFVEADRSAWIFDEDGTQADATENLVLTPAAGTGRWLRLDKAFDIKLAISYANTDAQALFTVPAGMRLLLEQAFWEITADFTGGTSSAIGLSSDTAPHSTKGDLLGGTAGDVAADLQAADGVTQGTIGASFSAAPKMVVLEAGSVVRFDRIASAFTAGTGFVHLSARMIS